MDISIDERFGREFRLKLGRKFGRLPSAAFVSCRFNLHLGRDCDGVSGETVRRWMRGHSMPTYQHLEALVGWLELDLDLVFQPKNKASQNRSNSAYLDAFMALTPQLQESVMRFLRCAPMVSQQIRLSGFDRSASVKDRAGQIQSALR